MSDSQLAVSVSSSAEALASLREEWDALLARSARPTIFQTWEWNESWWRAFGRGRWLRLIEMRRGTDGPLVGIAPLYVSQHLGTPLLRLAFLGTGASDYLDVIAAEEDSAAVCGALLEHLATSTWRDFDLADLQQLSPGSHLREHWRAGTGPRGAQVVERDQEPCPYVPLHEDWDTYTRSLGKKTRSNIGYYDRLLPKAFERVEIKLADATDLEPSLTALFELHQRRWNALLLPGVLGGRRTQWFHRDVAARLLDRGWLRLHVAWIDGEAAAALYCFRFRERTCYYLGGFSPAMARYSLGTVLTARAIRTAIEEGCAEFDFLRGDEPYKQRWQPRSRSNARLLLSRPRSLRSGAMLRLNRLEDYVEHRAKAFAASRKRR